MMRNSMAPGDPELGTCMNEDRLIGTRTTRVHQDFREPRGAPGSDLPVNTLAKVDNPRPDGEPPAKISETVLG